MAWPSETLHYKLNDDAASTTVVDSSSNALNATLVGANTADISVTGKINDALSFNGSSQYITRAYNAVMNPTNALSMSLWVKPTAVANGDMFVHQIAKCGISYGNVFGITGSVPGFYIFKGGGWVAASFGSSLSNGVWACVQGKFDGTNLYVRVNGSAWVTVSSSGSIDAGTPDLYIGGYPAETYHHNGVLDDVRIYYSNALTDEQFDAIYNGGNGTEESLANLEPTNSISTNWNRPSIRLGLGI